MMGRFYWDIEFTNGNYYLTDILEIAVVAGSGKNIPQICKDTLLGTKAGTVAFIRRETTEPAIIIAHYAHEFPSCMKHNYSDFAVLEELACVDSM